MSEIYIQSSQAIQDIITQLAQLNNAFREDAQNIDTEHKNLVTKWQGDASTASEEHYQNERGNFEAFATTIEDYIAKLQEILANWEAAESANVQIGSD